MHRFFVDSTGLSAEQRRQIATVLRLKAGETITLVRDGEESDLRLTAVSPDAVEGEVIGSRPTMAEPTVALTLALPLLKGDRTEEIIEATAQLGVTTFAPFVAARSVIHELSATKRKRWERIALEAAETARRGRVPSIEDLRDWPALLAALPRPMVLAWEEDGEHPLERALRSATALSLVIGPEGGLTMVEVDAARAAGGTVVTLGRRILRAETAAISAVARVMAVLDLGS